MGLGANTSNTTGNNPADNTEEKNKSWSDWAEIVAGWIVDLFAVPIAFVTAIMAHLLGDSPSGKKVIGAIGFWIGTVFSTDSIWQTFFQGTPMFPFFESNWIGWTGWLTLPFNPLFWVSLVISYVIQTQEGKSLRGKMPAEAKQEFEEGKQFTLPEKPKNVIDISKALWRDYKRAGMRQRNTGGLISIGFWIFDLISTFVSRWPWRYSNPGVIIGCLAYNIGTMSAGEVGYHLWKHSK